MRTCLVRVVLGAGMVGGAGCGDGSTNPSDGTASYETTHFIVVDESGAPRSLIDSLAAVLEFQWPRVGEFLVGFVPPERVRFNLRAGPGIPYAALADNSMNQWRETLSFEDIPHELTHLWTRSSRGAFLEEGIAVHVTHVLQPASATANPYRAQPPHAWVALFEQFGSTIPLETALSASGLSYDFHGSSADASAWQIYLEAGSFTQWVLDRFGYAFWSDMYRTAHPAISLGVPLEELETAWLMAAQDAFPQPLACEEALATLPLTGREEFWCARARGE
ncbi:MAG TPA: hypothetical protein VGA37_12450 [Gemmatimonadales bacterium]